ncbi:unnamed protein product [Fraxinus pennsylvanica]|uniref:Uncharacterized protein n=1 Tax=Fraxinus pennsylvanica TaxID=56036 RepID=A0AAD2A2S0_9LAMI|nr:unnamed protein product [Fraxinus pennsylvanica]
MMSEQQQQMRLNLRKRNDHSSRSTHIEEDEEKLQIVDLSGMSLECIPESLTARLLNVVVLDVHSNQLKSLPNSIGCLSKLKILNVAGNLLQSLPQTIENCRLILSQIPDTIGFELLSLKKLSVNSNKLVFLPHSTSHLTNLRVLDTRRNCLRSLPEDLENLINLQVLNISQNFKYLTTLPYSIGLLISLVELDVSYNKITALPESIGCLKKLQKLSVEGNPLVSPPMDIFEQGLLMVKEYLCEKINGSHKNSPKKKSWFGKLAKCSTFSGANLPLDDREGYIMQNYRSIEHLASPRYMGMFSPKSLFSPKSYRSR